MAVRRRRRKMTARQRKYFAPRGRKRSPVRRRRRARRRNAWPVAGLVTAANPRRRRRHRRHRVSNPRRRRHGHRNPAILGLATPSIKSVAFAGIGFIGPSMVSSFLTTTFPSVMQTTTGMGIAGKYIVKIGSVLALAWATRRFVGTNESHMVMIGGGINIAMTLANDFAPGFLPANPLAMYIPNRQAGNMRAYVPLRGLRGPINTTAVAFPARALQPTQPFSSGGAYGGTAMRFKRF